MSSKKKTFIYLLAIVQLVLLSFTFLGCKEGTSSNPVGSIINPNNNLNNVSMLDTSKLGSATYKLTGLVFSDSSKQPVGNAKVQLYYIDANTNKFNAGETLTTSEGRFFFMNLPAGLYSIETPSNLLQYATTTYVVQILDGGEQSPANPTIFLKNATNASGSAKIPVKAKISGTLYNSSDKSKIQNEVINLVLNNNIIATTVSSEVGYFEFTDLGTGSYRIEAAKDSPLYSSKAFSITINDNGVVIPPTLPIFLSPKTVENYRISGSVTESGQALSNISIELRKDSSSSAIIKKTNTSGEGKFFFENLSSGNYFLTVAANSATYESLVYPVTILSDGTISPKIANISIVKKTTASTYSISGRIYDAITGGPIEYALCNFASKGGFTTDAAGNFQFYAVSPGSYKFTIKKDGFETLETSIKVNDDGTTAPKKLNFPLVNATLEGYGTIAGRLVKESTEKGIVGKIVRLYIWHKVTKSDSSHSATKPPETDWELGGMVLTTRTNGDNPDTVGIDESGSFKLTHLAPTKDDSKYLLYFGEDVPTSVSPNITYVSRADSNYTWLDIVPDGNYLESIRNMSVESGKTTYWTNYEHEK